MPECVYCFTDPGTICIHCINNPDCTSIFSQLNSHVDYILRPMDHALSNTVFNMTKTSAWSRGALTYRTGVMAAAALLGLWHAQAGAADLVAPCPPTSALAAPAPRMAAARAAAPRAARPRAVAAKATANAAGSAQRIGVGQETRPQASGGGRAKNPTKARQAKRAPTAPVATPFAARPLPIVNNACQPASMAAVPMASLAPAAPSLAALIVGTPPSAPEASEFARIVPVSAQGPVGSYLPSAPALLGATDELDDQGRETPGMSGSWPELLNLPDTTIGTVNPGVPAEPWIPSTVDPQDTPPSNEAHDVPEPGSLALWLTGLFAAWQARRRHMRRASTC